MEQHSVQRAKSILWLAASYFVVWLDLFIPVLAFSPFSTAWFAASIAKNILRIAFIALIMKEWRGFPAYTLGVSGFLPKAKDVAGSLPVAASAAAVALCIALISVFANVSASNPLFQFLQETPLTAGRLFLVFAASLGVGYSEELFFRFFAVTSLESAGFPQKWAAVAGAVLFGASHSAQGLPGMLEAALLGLIFSLFRLRGKNLHTLALGHALYDFIALVAVMQA